MQVLGQMCEGLIQPSLLLERDPPPAGELTRFPAEDHSVHVFVSQHGPQVRPGPQAGAQVHHVAVVAKGRRERGIEVRHSHETVQGMAAVGQPVQPTREQDREAAIPIDVAGQPHRAGGDGNDPVVERRNQVLQQLGIHPAEILHGHVDLNPLADRTEDSPDGQVIACAGNVSIADHQREITLPWRHSADRLLDRLRLVPPEPRRTIGGCVCLLGNSRIRDRNRLEPDRKRSGGPRKRRDDHQRLGALSRRRKPESGLPLMDGDRNRNSRTPEPIAEPRGATIGCPRSNPHQHHDQWHQQQAQAPSGESRAIRNNHPKSPPRRTIRLARGTAGGLRSKSRDSLSIGLARSRA